MSAIQRKKGICAKNVISKGSKKKTRIESKKLLKKVADTFNRPSYPFAGGTNDW